MWSKPTCYLIAVLFACNPLWAAISIGGTLTFSDALEKFKDSERTYSDLLILEATASATTTTALEATQMARICRIFEAWELALKWYDKAVQKWHDGPEKIMLQDERKAVARLTRGWQKERKPEDGALEILRMAHGIMTAEQAMVVANETIAFAPNLWEAYAIRADLHLQMKSYEAALADCKKATNAGGLLAEKRVEKLIRNAQESNEVSRALVELRRARMGVTNVDTADLLKTLWDRYPNRLDVGLYYCRELYKKKNFAGAKTTLNQIENKLSELSGDYDMDTSLFDFLKERLHRAERLERIVALEKKEATSSGTSSGNGNNSLIEKFKLRTE